MRSILKVITLASLLLGLSVTASQAFAIEAIKLSVTPPQPQKLILKRGGNLTGLFQYGEYSATRLNEINTMKTVGVDFIRLPIEPSRFYDANSPDWQNLKDTIARANKLGITVIVDLHPLFSTQRAALTGEGDPRYPALLTKMAQFLRQFNQKKVVLELMNEPISPSDDTCDPNFDWNSWQRKFYRAARMGNDNIWLILTGACWGGIDGLLQVEKIPDSRVIYSFHYYDPFPFTHQSASWTGLEQFYLRQVPYPANAESVARITPTILYGVPTEAQKGIYRKVLEDYAQGGFNRATTQKRIMEAKNWASKNNVRLIMGEFGVFSTNAPPQDRAVWMRDVRQVAESLSIAHAIWDFSSTGTFGPYRNGKLEAGALAALGLKLAAGALPTPANPPINPAIKANPSVTNTLAIADFENGSKNLANMPVNYFNYGKPTMPEATAPGENGGAPIANGKVAFDFSIPAENEWGGVGIAVPTGTATSTQFTHVRFTLSASNSGQYRVGLGSTKVDTGGDYPQMTIVANPKPTVYTMPFSVFAQAGWGKKAKLADVIANIDIIEITATEVGKAGRVEIDNVQLLKMQ